MAAVAKNSKVPSRRIVWVIRGLLIVAVILIAFVLLEWRSLAVQCNRGVEMCNQKMYAEAESVLAPLLHKPLSAFRIGAKAREVILECRLRMASEIVKRAGTLEGYIMARQRLEEAKALYGTSPKIERRIQEYTKYIDKLSQPAEPEVQEVPLELRDAPADLT